MKLRWKEFTFALLMAITLWYAVSGSEKMESLIEVRVDYRGLPQGLTVQSGLVNKISVRVRAPFAMLRALTVRDSPPYIMDLSTVTRGENLMLIDSSQLSFRSNIEVIDITPSRITLQVDALSSKEVPLAADIRGALPEDYIAQVSFSPQSVTISGPSSVLDGIDYLTLPVTLSEPVVTGITHKTQRVHLPESVDSSPMEVNLSIHIGIKRKLVSVTRSVQVDTPAGFGKFVRPDKVKIQVAVPESQAGKASSDKDIKAFVNVEQSELGSYSLPVLVSLPDGMELVRVDPPNVTVTLEQKR